MKTCCCCHKRFLLGDLAKRVIAAEKKTTSSETLSSATGSLCYCFCIAALLYKLLELVVHVGGTHQVMTSEFAHVL